MPRHDWHSHAASRRAEWYQTFHESPLGSTLSLFNIIDFIVEWPETFNENNQVTSFWKVVNPLTFNDDDDNETLIFNFENLKHPWFIDDTYAVWFDKVVNPDTFKDDINETLLFNEVNPLTLMMMRMRYYYLICLCMKYLMMLIIIYLH